MSHRVLFIDDDAALLKALGDYFARSGCEVHRARSGPEGVETFDRVQPDVTVLDLLMPEMSGMEVLDALRQRDATVIMLTAHGEIESAVDAMRRGAENFLVKPVDVTYLVQAVDKAAETHRLRLENKDLRGHLPPGRRWLGIRLGFVAALVIGSFALGLVIGAVRASRDAEPGARAADTAEPAMQTADSVTFR